MVILVTKFRESNLKENEMYTRLTSILDLIKSSTPKEDIKIPFTIPTISLGYVLRENNLILLPYSLMVKGDVIRMAFGDVAPEKVELISDKRITLNKGDILTPKSLGNTIMENFYYFRMLESPFKSIVMNAKSFSRKETVIKSQIKILELDFRYRIIWIILGVSLGINSARYFPFIQELRYDG